MEKTYRKSAAELVELAKTLATENSEIRLPTTPAGIAYRVEKENWDYEEAPTQGGKGGMKKVYFLPDYLIDEIKEKGFYLQTPKKDDWLFRL